MTNLKVDLDASGSNTLITVGAIGTGRAKHLHRRREHFDHRQHGRRRRTVNATALASGGTLDAQGLGPEAVSSLSAGAISATGLSGALNVTTGAATALSIATGSGSSLIDASAMTSGTLTLTGAHAATVNAGANLAADADTGALNVTGTGSSPHSIQTGGGADTITAHTGGDTIRGSGGADTISVVGHSAADAFVYAATSNSLNTAGHDTITGFDGSGPISDLLDFSRLANSSLTIQGPVANGSKIAANSIAWVNLGATDMVYVNATNGVLASTNGNLMEITLNSVTGSLSASNFILHA